MSIGKYVYKDRNAFISRFRQSKKTCLSLKMEAIRSFETSVTLCQPIRTQPIGFVSSTNNFCLEGTTKNISVRIIFRGRNMNRDVPKMKRGFLPLDRDAGSYVPQLLSAAPPPPPVAAAPALRIFQRTFSFHICM